MTTLPLNDFGLPLPGQDDEAILDEMLALVRRNAVMHLGKKPTLAMLLEEVSELAHAINRQHEHPMQLELTQIAGICLNWMRLLAREDCYL